MTLHVEIPDDLYARTDAELSRRGISHNDFVAGAYEKLLCDQQVAGTWTDAEITAAYQKAVAEDPDAFKLDPVVEEHARHVLLQAEW